MESLTGNVYIGRYHTQYAKGLIDDVRIYNRVLDLDTEIKKNWRHGSGKHKD